MVVTELEFLKEFVFCSFSYICIICLPSCMVNKYYYIQRRNVTLKSNRSRSLKMGPIDRSYSRACVTITSSGVCFVSKQHASTSFHRQVLSTLLVQRWRGVQAVTFGYLIYWLVLVSVSHCKYSYLLPFSTYLTLKNIVTFKSSFRVDPSAEFFAKFGWLSENCGWIFG